MSSVTTVENFDNLRDRVLGLLVRDSKKATNSNQLSLSLSQYPEYCADSNYTGNIVEFLDLIKDLVPGGELYLFGGVLRDLALNGRKGFQSDLDLVVEGDWSPVVGLLEGLKASKNKFGGYRLLVGEFPVDIWNARDTWAVKQGHVKYHGISSLLDSTVLNWDAILMNWRTQQFVAYPYYLELLRQRKMHIVLQKNPNPLGMATRVFRHLCMKDARQITRAAANYLATCTRQYSFEELTASELASYGTVEIQLSVYEKFDSFDKVDILDDAHSWEVASEIVRQDDILHQSDSIFPVTAHAYVAKTP